METYTLFVFVLVALGFAVMAAEVMVPSLGLLSMLALACFAGSTFFAWKVWYATDHLLIWWSYVFSLLIAIPGALVGMFYLLPRTALGRRAMVMPPRPEDVRPYVAEEARLRSFIDCEGLTASMFSPGGMVVVGGEKFHAESEGVIIDSGSQVIVVGLKGNRLVVRTVEMQQLAVASRPAVSEELSELDDPDLAELDVRVLAEPEASNSSNHGAADDAASVEKSRHPEAIDFDVPDAT